MTIGEVIQIAQSLGIFIKIALYLNLSYIEKINSVPGMLVSG
jgi:hypothetical protein